MAKKELPFISQSVKAGFPNPAQDLPDEKLSLQGYLVKNPASTFFMRAEGDSMKGAGIVSGDILVVDKSLDPKNNDIVVAQIDGEFTLKQFVRKGKTGFLKPANPDYPVLELSEDNDFTVWGVVIASVTKFV